MKPIILILFLLLSNNSFCQEPPCAFKLSYDSKAVAEEFLETYEISTAVYDGPDLENLPTYSQNTTSDQAIYAYLPELTVNKGALIVLLLKHKDTNKTMSLYIRIVQEMKISEKLELLNMVFTEGYYFYDLCDSMTADKSDYTTDNKRPKSILLTGIANYKTSLKRITATLKKKNKC